MPVSSIDRLGWVCAGLITVMLAVSFPLRCFPRAGIVTVVSMCAGAALGLALGMITRTRRPLAIYFWLGICALTVLPLIFAWPQADSFDVVLWRGAPDIFNNYFDLLRGGVYLIALPFPFARFGRHAPDVIHPDESGPPT